MTQLLATILAIVMTWTVENKSTVSGDGTWPYDIEVAYSNTNNKGTVRSGDDAVLTLSHLEGITVERVDVYVKSNKTGGGGSFAVTANGATLATKSGTFKSWIGRYDNDSYHAITLFSGQKTDVDELVVSLHGTENSLYVEKYVIQYAMASLRTVTLMKGNQLYAQLTEEQSGVGVLLPSMPDTAQWSFIGWSETAFSQTEAAPFLPLEAGSLYHPGKNGVLWAVYAYFDPLEQVYVTELESGEYLYVNTHNKIALKGTPTGGKMNYAQMDPSDDNQVYTVDFAGSDTAYITHTMSGTPIGYEGTNMAAVASPWSVYHNGEETRFYTVINNKTYVLWLGVWGISGEISAGLFQTESTGTPLALCYPDKLEAPVYTCFPEYGLGWQDVPAGANGAEYILRLGNYELRINNGRKELKIEE